MVHKNKWYSKNPINESWVTGWTENSLFSEKNYLDSVKYIIICEECCYLHLDHAFCKKKIEKSQKRILRTG